LGYAIAPPIGVSGPLRSVNKSEAFINPEVSDSKASLLKLSRSLDPPVRAKFEVSVKKYHRNIILETMMVN
jgi:hypothetical protein